MQDDLKDILVVPLEAMKVDQIKYHCMIHVPTNEIYAVAGVEYMPQFKEGYYRVWTRLSRIPNKNIPMTKMVGTDVDMKCLNLMDYFILIVNGQMNNLILKQHLALHLQTRHIQITMLKVQTVLQII